MKLKIAALTLLPFSLSANLTLNTNITTEVELKLRVQAYVQLSHICRATEFISDLEAIALTKNTKQKFSEDREQIKIICDQKNEMFKLIKALEEKLIKEGKTKKEIDSMIIDTLGLDK